MTWAGGTATGSRRCPSRHLLVSTEAVFDDTVPWWAVGAAIAAPVLLIGGVSVATAVQPASYDPVRNTISELAERGAADSWVMTSALVGVGSCYLLAALGLKPAARVGRVTLACGGVADSADRCVPSAGSRLLARA